MVIYLNRTAALVPGHLDGRLRLTRCGPRTRVRKCRSKPNRPCKVVPENMSAIYLRDPREESGERPSPGLNRSVGVIVQYDREDFLCCICCEHGEDAPVGVGRRRRELR